MVQLLHRSGSGRNRGRKRALWTVGVIVVAGAGLWLTKEPLLWRYRYWKQERALEQAREFVAARDSLNAQLALDVALKAAPGNVDTIRTAADILEQVGAGQSMRLRRAVTQLRPDSAEDAARLVFCCLRFRDFNGAKDALAQASPEISKELPMLQAALAYALATGDAPVADALLTALHEKLPDDRELRVTQALLHLRHPAKRAEAERYLEQIVGEQPARALRINRELASAALERQDYAEARRRLDLVLADPAATLEDRLQKANVEVLIDNRPFENVYAELNKTGARDAIEAAQMMRWLLVQKRTAEAGKWLTNLPPEIRQDRGMLALEADMFAQAGAWDKLAPMLEAGVWGPVPAECIRLAMSARLVEAQNNRALRGEIWDAATQAARGSLSAYGVLHRLATLWRWEKEVESTLWTVARAYPDQTWAHQALFNSYKEQANTAGMRDVLSLLRQSDGSVPRYRHDWALLTLLREPTPLWNPAKDTMRELHEWQPKNAVYASGYAFALAQAERLDEALAVLNRLPEAEREFGLRLPYVAYVYGMARRSEEVTRLAALAKASGLRYLPEEVRLLETAIEAPSRPAAKIKRVREAKAMTASGESGDPAKASAPEQATRHE
jgi:hypothetical protein